MPIINVENLDITAMRVKLHEDLSKATSAEDRMTIYSAYSHSLHEYEMQNCLQNNQYRSMRMEIADSALDNHLENLHMHSDILGIIDSTLITYKPANASQALIQFDTGALDNPYGMWGYNASLGKHYIRLYCQQADGGMWMANASKLINMTIVVKDNNETYIGNAGETVVDTEDGTDPSTFTTGSNRYIMLYFSNKATRDKLVRPLFQTDELINEKVHFKPDYKFPQSGIGYNWATTATEASNLTPTWLVEKIGRA